MARDGVAVEVEEPTTLRHLVRELPRKRVALVMVALLLYAVVFAWWRGWQIPAERHEKWKHMIHASYGPSGDERELARVERARSTWVSPWDWTADEWRETVWPWK